jgi:hypothetical protein
VKVKIHSHPQLYCDTCSFFAQLDVQHFAQNVEKILLRDLLRNSVSQPVLKSCCTPQKIQKDFSIQLILYGKQRREAAKKTAELFQFVFLERYFARICCACRRLFETHKV